MNEDINLEQQLNLDIPPPLDPHIASIELVTFSNNPADNFELGLMANFGSEVINIKSGEHEVKATITIYQAEVKLDAINCSLQLRSTGSNDAFVVLDTITQRVENSTEITAGAGVELSLTGPNLGAGLKAETGQLSSQIREQKIEREVYPLRILNSSHIQIGYGVKPPLPLSGQIINERKLGIIAKPTDTSRQVGVMARLRVRNNWIEFSDYKGGPKISRLLRSKDTQKKELFELLIKELVLKKLQNEKETRDATLAASAIVYSPVSEEMTGVPGPKSQPRIEIDPSAVEDFLKAKPGEEHLVLKKYGIKLGQKRNDPTQRSLGVIRTEFQEFWNELFREGIWVPYHGSTQSMGNLNAHLQLELSWETLIFKKKEGFYLQLIKPIRKVKVAPPRSSFSLPSKEGFRLAQILGFPLGLSSFLSRVKEKSYRDRKTGRYQIPLSVILDINELDVTSEELLDGMVLLLPKLP